MWHYLCKKYITKNIFEQKWNIIRHYIPMQTNLFWVFDIWYGSKLYHLYYLSRTGKWRLHEYCKRRESLVKLLEKLNVCNYEGMVCILEKELVLLICWNVPITNFWNVINRQSLLWWFLSRKGMIFCEL